ncbi:WD40 repeat domain-containing protein [Planctomycetota bacterium]
MDVWQAEYILLGRGGTSPGLVTYNLLSGELTEILSLPQGDSVYSIVARSDHEIVVIGTKRGRVYLLAPPTSDRQGKQCILEQYEAGDPILSLCFVGPSTLAVSNVTGGIWLWEIGNNCHEQQLEKGISAVYALFHFNDEYLAGLSVSGELLIWDISTYQLVGTAAIPKPPEFTALVKPIYWKGEDLWVWPGHGGLIVLFNPEEGMVQVLRGHTDDVYALTICDEQLTSIGAVDCQYKHWRPGCDQPTTSLKAPDAVISITAWEQQASQFLLVDALGEAAVYSRSATQLEHVASLPGKDYRAILGPDPVRFESIRAHRESEKVRHLVKQAEELIARKHWDELESIYQQITDYGYPHVMLALRGQETHLRDDLLGELQVRYELATMIPHDQQGSEDSLRRYAELLESVWQLREAVALYQQLTEAGFRSNGYSERIRTLNDHLQAMRSTPYVVEAEESLPLLVEAATHLGVKFSGRYQIVAARAIQCQVCVSVDEVMDRYEHLIASKPREEKAEKVTLCWLSRDKQEQVNAIVLSDANPDSFTCLELIVRFFHINTQTIVIPTIVLNADVSCGVDAKQHNHVILSQLQQLEDVVFLKSWSQTRYQNINMALRQLKTRGLALAASH